MDKEMSVRVERLERDNRRLKVVGTLAAGVLGIAWLLGAAFDDKEKVPDVVRAKKFLLIGPTGNTFARLHTETFRVGEDMVLLFPKLEFVSNSGDPRLTLGGGANSAPFVELSGASGTKMRLEIYAAEPSLTLTNKQEKMRAKLGLTKEGAPYLVLVGEKRGDSAAVRVPATGPRLILTGENFKEIWKAP